MEHNNLHHSKLRWVWFLIVAFGLCCSPGFCASIKGLYVGDDFYAPGTTTQNAARSTGFTRIFLHALNINTNGDLYYNSTLVVQNGVFMGDPTWGAKLAALKVQPTCIERIEIVIGGGEKTSFANIKNLIATRGTGTNSILHQNFLALKNATGLDVVQFNDQQTYDVPSSVAFGRLMASLGMRVTLHPRFTRSYWTAVKTQLGDVDAIYPQCYDESDFKDPGLWNSPGDRGRVFPCLWGNEGTPSSVTTKMRNWQNTLGITGGCMWLNGFMPADSAKWAQALSYGLDPLCSFRIINKNSGKSFGLMEGATTNGSTIDQRSYIASSGQQWSLVPTEDGDHYKIISWASGKCASIATDTISRGGRLWVWDYNNDPSQQFDLVHADHGWFKIKNVRSGLVLEVAGGSMANNAAVQQNVDIGAARQEWRLYPYTDAMLAYENFDYPVGDLSGKNGGEGWNAGWMDDMHSAAKVTASNLVGGTNVPEGYDAQSLGGGAFVANDERVGRYLDCSVNGVFGAYGYLNGNGHIGADGTTLYISFLQQPSSTALFYEFELNRESERIAGIGNDLKTNCVNLRAPSESFTPIGKGSTNVNFYVMRIDFKPGNDDVRVYQNPTSNTEPGVPTLTRSNVADMSFDRISLAAFANDNTVRNDQIRIATSWRYVIGAAPESLFQASSNIVSDDIFRRVRISAQVLLGNEQMYYLIDGQTGLRVLLSQPAQFEPGDVVDVMGLVQQKKQSVILMEAVARKTGHAALPKPLPLSDPDSSRHSDWVWTEGILTSSEINGGELILTMQVGLKSVEARLRIQKESPLSLPVGSRLKLTGVYVPRTSNKGNQNIENTFCLFLSSPAAVEVIARPPWWTLKRVLFVVAFLVTGLALASIWISLLRRKVEQHAIRLKREITEREQAERARIIEEERSRISRDLHDDLGSLLTQVSMLATFSPGMNITIQSARERIGLIAEKSYRMIVALDEVVWMMNPKNETLSSFAAYLAAYAEEFLSKTDIVCRIEGPSSYPLKAITAEVRNHLFSSVKEAVNNAVRHGKPSQLSLEFSVVENRFEIKIHDNGAGFDPLSVSRGNGLTNLKERMLKINGQCQIHTSAKAGTKVILQLPLA